MLAQRATGARVARVSRAVSLHRRTAGAAFTSHLYFPFSNSEIAVRLTSIKLAGFKSFVDPTHFQVPGQLVGVVGPNGCGKSNIIDAVRWVLGESRASELRGESMQDVIFNGSTARKPGSRASVELVFDNADGRAAGQWGQYAEIAVKRVLTRDGTSSYYINNLPARRRDIQDIFLGTGLGPRAYAIIGQGMIARLIEAKPEELRVFLEEAAGVSKYKERRRETENRLHDTRENLTRVEDIVRELSANLEKLEAQAVVATTLQGTADRRRREAASVVAVAQERSRRRAGTPATRDRTGADRPRSANREAARSRSATRNAARRALLRQRRDAGRARRAVRGECRSQPARSRDQVHRRIAQPRAGADRRADRAARAVAVAGAEGARRYRRR